MHLQPCIICWSVPPKSLCRSYDVKDHHFEIKFLSTSHPQHNHLLSGIEGPYIVVWCSGIISPAIRHDPAMRSPSQAVLKTGSGQPHPPNHGWGLTSLQFSPYMEPPRLHDPRASRRWVDGLSVWCPLSKKVDPRLLRSHNTVTPVSAWTAYPRDVLHQANHGTLHDTQCTNDVKPLYDKRHARDHLLGLILTGDTARSH